MRPTDVDLSRFAPTHRHVEHCMGTAFSIDVRAPGVAQQALADAIGWLHRMDAMFSTYRADSEICRLNRAELTLADCAPEVHEILRLGTELQTATGGYFSLWHNGELDPSGLVKGWAIERFDQLLRLAGSRNHCVNGGGDVQCYGRPAPGQLWQIGIADPLDRAALIGSVAGAEIAVATSGTAERGLHLINPLTGERAAELASLTVIGPSVRHADVYATAGFAMGGSAIEWLDAMAGYEGLAIGLDGSRAATRGLIL